MQPGGPLDCRGLDGIVNLAGESILGLWTKTKRQRILESRLQTTGSIVAGLRGLGGACPLVSASAVGIYGNRGDEELTEDAAAGTGFLANVARQWESAAKEAEPAGARVALVRIGLVMGPDGGAYPPLRKLFQLGLGGRLGNGRQWMSPVHVADVAGLIVHLLDDGQSAGAFNAACPAPVRNEAFTRTVARALHRPALLPAPAFALRLALGDLSHLLLDSTRVLPQRTQAAGYEFRHPNLEAILANLTAT